MQTLEPSSPKENGEQSLFEPVLAEQIVVIDSSSSKSKSASSNANNYDSFEQQCFSPIKINTKQPSLEKKVSFEVGSSSQLLIKKAESLNEVKHIAKTLQKKAPDSPTKLSKSVSAGNSAKKFSIKGVDFPLLEGEDLLARQECLMLIGTDKFNGFLIVTNYRILFLQGPKYLFDIPVGFIATVDRQVEQKPITWSKIQITTKFGKLVKLRFNTQPETSNQVYKILKKYSSGDITTMFAFAYARHNTPKFQIQLAEGNERKSRGWEMDMIKEYEKMGISFDEDSLFKKVSNPGGKLCLSYPTQFVITKRVKEQTLTKCLKARIRERIPVLSYFHAEKSKKVSCLWRAAHCRSSVTSNSRNFSDEEYVKCLALEENKQKSLMLLVYDIRPKTNSLNVFYENSLVKQVTDLHSLLLMRESFNKFASSYQSDTSVKWVNGIEESKWFQQIAKLLSYAEQIALKMKNGNPILVQCTDGSDRSAQICVLAQLFLCPRFRTIEGFQALITKEFIWLGYPFADRLRGSDEERVPTLIQLLDCVHQMTVAFPLSFQFNSKYLASLAESLYTNKYGNFLTNSPTEFTNKNISQFSLSFWNRHVPETQINSYFKKNFLFLQTLTPVPSAMFLKVWHEFLEIITGTRTKSDVYKINPNAQCNRDYLILNHQNLKHQSSQFKLLVDEQISQIELLRKQLEEAKQEN